MPTKSKKGFSYRRFLEIVSILGVVGTFVSVYFGWQQVELIKQTSSFENEKNATQNAAYQAEANANSTQVAALEQMATIQADGQSASFSTAEAEEFFALQTSISSAATEQAAAEATAESIQTGPILEHNEISVGTGVFAFSTISAGDAPYSETWLEQNGHNNAQRIWANEEYVAGCNYAKIPSQAVWVSAGKATTLFVNGDEVGRLTATDSRLKHGVVVKLTINVGDYLCVSPVPNNGYHLFFGPDIYYHYDSYCFRGFC